MLKIKLCPSTPVVSCLAFLLLTTGCAYGEQKPSTVISCANPAAILHAQIMQGETAELTGPLSDTMEETVIEVRNNGQVVATKTFAGIAAWQIDVSTAGWSVGEHFLSLSWSRHHVTPKRLARVRILVSDSPPIKLAVSAPVNGSVTLSMTATGAVKAVDEEVTLDGHSIPAAFDTAGNANIPINSVAVGGHILGMKVHLADGGIYSALDVPFTIPSAVALTPLDGGTVIDLRNDSTVPFVQRFSVIAGVSPASIDLLIDGAAVVTKQQTPLDQITFDPSNLTSGNHRLIVRVTDSSGATHDSVEESLQVVRDGSRDHLDSEFTSLLNEQKTQGSEWWKFVGQNPDLMRLAPRVSSGLRNSFVATLLEKQKSLKQMGSRFGLERDFDKELLEHNFGKETEDIIEKLSPHLRDSDRTKFETASANYRIWFNHLQTLESRGSLDRNGSPKPLENYALELMMGNGANDEALNSENQKTRSNLTIAAQTDQALVSAFSTLKVPYGLNAVDKAKVAMGLKHLTLAYKYAAAQVQAHLQKQGKADPDSRYGQAEENLGEAAQNEYWKADGYLNNMNAEFTTENNFNGSIAREYDDFAAYGDSYGDTNESAKPTTKPATK